MSELFSLPDELLIMILSHCSTSDLLQISRVCKKLNDITCDRKVVKVINLNYCTGLSQDLAKSFLTFRPRAQNITTIDLTSCYWLTSSYIFQIIRRLINVESVLVADTALLPNHLQQLLLTLPRMKRLSWTWHDGMNEELLGNVLNKIEFLYICVRDSKFLQKIIKFANKCTELRDLWINHVEMFWYTKCPLILEHLERIVLYPCTSILIVQTASMVKQYWQANPINNIGNNQLKCVQAMYATNWSEICDVVELGSKNIERISSPAPADDTVIELLSVADGVTALNLVLPDKFSLNTLLLHRLPLKELSLWTDLNNQVCSETFCETVAACHTLRRLSLPVQALVCRNKTTESASMVNSRKRVSRVLHSVPCDEETQFSKMVESTPDVEVFEIGVSCKNHKPRMPIHLRWDFHSLSMVGRWKQLTSLTLANLPINHGKFFTSMLMNCKHLKRLRILNLGPQASSIYTIDMCAALPYCKELEDFYWSQSNVGRTSKLWVALQQIATLKRIALSLDGLSDVEDTDVYLTMEKCSSLFFLHVASSTAKSKSKQIKQNVVARWLKIRPHLIVWLGWPGEARESVNRFPTVHAQDMLLRSSSIVAEPVCDKQCLSFGQREWAPHI